MRNTRYEKGFTLVELLVALMVTSIVLAAVATLAYAMGRASDVSNDTSRKQAQVRYATLRVSELVRNCKLIFSTTGYNMFVWRADDNGNGLIDLDEIVYVTGWTSRDRLWFYEFSSSSTLDMAFDDIEQLVLNLLSSGYTQGGTELIPQCSNVRFRLDQSPPQARGVSILFNLSENDIVHQYQINAALRGWAGHLLNEDGDTIVQDDD